MSADRPTGDDQCEHGVEYDAECATCDREIVEAQNAGAWTPKEIGLYWKGRNAARADKDAAAIAAVRALVQQPEVTYPADCDCPHGMGFQFHRWPCRYAGQIDKATVLAVLDVAQPTADHDTMRREAAAEALREAADWVDSDDGDGVISGQGLRARADAVAQPDGSDQ